MHLARFRGAMQQTERTDMPVNRDCQSRLEFIPVTQPVADTRKPLVQPVDDLPNRVRINVHGLPSSGQRLQQWRDKNSWHMLDLQAMNPSRTLRTCYCLQSRS